MSEFKHEIFFDVTDALIIRTHNKEHNLVSSFITKPGETIEHLHIRIKCVEQIMTAKIEIENARNQNEE